MFGGPSLSRYGLGACPAACVEGEASVPGRQRESSHEEACLVLLASPDPGGELDWPESPHLMKPPSCIGWAHTSSSVEGEATNLTAIKEGGYTAATLSSRLCSLHEHVGIWPCGCPPSCAAPRWAGLRRLDQVRSPSYGASQEPLRCSTHDKCDTSGPLSSLWLPGLLARGRSRSLSLPGCHW